MSSFVTSATRSSLTLLPAVSTALFAAQGKKGSSESPAGWEKGGKKSWEGEVPPGKSEDKPGKEGTQAVQKGQEPLPGQCPMQCLIPLSGVSQYADHGIPPGEIPF